METERDCGDVKGNLSLSVLFDLHDLLSGNEM